MKKTFFGFLLVVLLGLNPLAQATLWDRGGGLVYDDVLNVTWLQDANYGAGSSYDNGVSTTDGRMLWTNAVAWADNLSYFDSVRNTTWSDWRLPTVAPIGAIFNYNNSNNGTADHGTYITSPKHEMSYMFYVNLGNLGWVFDDGRGPYPLPEQPNFGLVNIGPFINLQPYLYWSGTEYGNVVGQVDAWVFANYDGGDWHSNKIAQPWNGVATEFYAWAVRPGDVSAPVPEPSTMLLLASGLVGLVGFRRKFR